MFRNSRNHPAVSSTAHAGSPPPLVPAIVDRAVWKKITKGRAGIRWDNVVDIIWKDLGGDQVLSIEKFGGYKTEVK